MHVHCLTSSAAGDASIRVQSDTACGAKTAWQQLATIATLNSRVVLQKKEGYDELQPTGDATELGLYRYFRGVIHMAFGMEIESFRDSNAKVFEIPFNSSNKWQLSIHRLSGSNYEGGCRAQSIFATSFTDMFAFRSVVSEGCS
jgi:magnesium-transporting ATPase (P-type)